MILSGYIFSFLYGIFCIAIASLAHKLGMKVTYSRKLAHILVGFEWVILSHYFGATVHFLIVCVVFTALVSLLHITKLAPGISSQSENSNGTIYYCVAMTVMSAIVMCIPDMMIPFGIGVFCTSLGDGFAGVFGQIKQGNKTLCNKKTMYGSLACFVFCFLSVVLISCVFQLQINLIYAAIVAIFAVELELFAKNGIDNITVTLGASFLSYYLINHSALILNYIAPLLLTLPIVAIVQHKKSLTKWGIVTALALDLVVSVAFNNTGFLILVIFFGGSIVSDKVKKSVTRENHEQRTAYQVLANGGLGIVFSVIHMLFPLKIWLVAFAAVFAEAFADTVASGFGSLSKNTFDPFRMKRVTSGESGGMTLLGTIASFLASSLIGLVAFASAKIEFFEFVVIAMSGFFGAIFDSFLGSVLQAKYICKACGKRTERKVHCSEATERVSGLSFINNNAVNLLGTLFASLVAIICMMILNKQ